jgi:8-oxo-dGTP diphosphatase
MGKEYPPAPIVAVGGVVVRQGRALLIRRAHEPWQGRWSIPGGVVELGEPLTEAVRRELAEETGLQVTVGPVVDVCDRVQHDADGRVRFHFVIVDYLCHAPAGEPTAGSDATAVAWVAEAELDALGVTPHLAAVISRAIRYHSPHDAVP